jgi:hypothetical protein
MKILILQITLFFVIFNSAVIGQDNIIKRTLPLEGDAEISYYIQEKGVGITFSPKKSILDQKYCSFHSGQSDHYAALLRKFQLYALEFDRNEIKGITKSIGIIKSSSDDLIDDNNFEFTIHVTNEGNTKLIIESTPKIGGLSHMIILDESNVKDAIKLLEYLPDLQKKASDRKISE